VASPLIPWYGVSLLCTRARARIRMHGHGHTGRVGHIIQTQTQTHTHVNTQPHTQYSDIFTKTCIHARTHAYIHTHFSIRFYKNRSLLLHFLGHCAQIYVHVCMCRAGDINKVCIFRLLVPTALAHRSASLASQDELIHQMIARNKPFEA
jgi:hypothetical protein